MPGTPKTALFVANLGSPESPDVNHVRSYLKEFLSDPDVLTMPSPARYALLNLIILPFRSPKSAEAYGTIWNHGECIGSPLIHYTSSFAEKLSNTLGENVHVETVMRYGNPGFTQAIRRCKDLGIERYILFSLYPQQAGSTTGSTEKHFRKCLEAEGISAPPEIMPPFFGKKEFIEAWKAPNPEENSHTLFSFHGLPESHIWKGSGAGPDCLWTKGCCDTLTEKNQGCYRAQCFNSAKLLADRFGLEEGTWSVSFQSRLGKTPWIMPHTDKVIEKLASEGKNLTVYCPAFVCDCLETIEEIGMQNMEMFKEAGGGNFTLMPCLNDSPEWVHGAAELVQKYLD